MPFIPFHQHFRQIAEHETRTLRPIDPRFGLPPAQYHFYEMFCDEPGCDCRRVFFHVVSSETRQPEAVIAWGWESLEFYRRWMRDGSPEEIKDLQGPVLNLGSPQSERAPALLRLTEEVLLKDLAYVERIKRHYRMFRDKIDGKSTSGAGRRRRRRKRKPASLPSSSKRKVSDMVWEFAGDYIRMGRTQEDKQTLLLGACSAWNMALRPPGEREKMLDGYMAVFRQNNPALDEDSIAAVRENMETLIRNRLRLFPQVRKQIVDCRITNENGTDRIQVATMKYE